jgi:hypothetical protein
LIPWVGGELAMASLENGFEKFGIEQIKLYYCLLKETRGGTNTWYWPDGSPGFSDQYSSDHSIWDIGAWMRALQECLAGIKDVTKQFEMVTCSPKWAATDVTNAKVVSHYPDTYSYFGYWYQYEISTQTLYITFSGSGKEVEFSVLLPADCGVKSVSVDGKEIPSSIRKIENSQYCEFGLKMLRTVADDAFKQLKYLKDGRRIDNIPNPPFELNQVKIFLHQIDQNSG